MAAVNDMSFKFNRRGIPKLTSAGSSPGSRSKFFSDLRQTQLYFYASCAPFVPLFLRQQAFFELVHRGHQINARKIVFKSELLRSLL